MAKIINPFYKISFLEYRKTKPEKSGQIFQVDLKKPKIKNKVERILGKEEEIKKILKNI
ncbi:hypothetical protein K8Q94_01390 [Candidatus Nomurabacteria bacterium]|nr:hypothetical protein [Candidatus Nomurabacteria bacterium]